MDNQLNKPVGLGKMIVDFIKEIEIDPETMSEINKRLEASSDAREARRLTREREQRNRPFFKRKTFWLVFFIFIFYGFLIYGGVTGIFH